VDKTQLDLAAQTARINDDVMTPLYEEYQATLRQGHTGMSELAAREANWALLQSFVDLLGIRICGVDRHFGSGALLAADPYGVRALQASFIWAETVIRPFYYEIFCPLLIIGDRPRGRHSRDILTIPVDPRLADDARLITLSVPVCEGLALLRDWPARIQSRAMPAGEAHLLYRTLDHCLAVGQRTAGSVTMSSRPPSLPFWDGRASTILEGHSLHFREQWTEKVGPSDDDLESFEITKQMGALAARFGKSKALERLFWPTPADEPTSQHGRVPWRRRVREAVASGLRAST
jgi:hypothetical protein